jgi:hypothetical protein
MGSSTARWFVENHIIYVQHLGHLTHDDFRHMDTQVMALMNSAKGNHKIHVMVDCYGMEGLPALSELEGGRILKYLWEPRTGWTIVADPKSNFMLKILSGILTGVAKAKFTMVKRLNEGVNVLFEADPILMDIYVPNMDRWAKELAQTPEHEQEMA